MSISSHLVFLAVFFALFILCYHATLGWMYVRASGVDSYYSHAFLIPIASAFLIWQKRDQLKGLHPEISRLGLIIIVFAALLHISGTILYVFSVSGFSIFFLIIGAALFLFGKEITKAISFPLAYLVFMFPLPLAILAAVSFPMKMLAAKVGVAVVRLLGVSVLRQGFTLTIPAGQLVVGNPCSGIRSLIAFLALGAVLAYLQKASNTRKIILFLLAIPIALLSNMCRVPLLILIAHLWGMKAASPASFLHDASGMFVFVVGFFMLLLAAKVLAWKK